MRALIILGIILLLVGSSGAIAFATEFASTNFSVSNPVIEELGGFSTSTSFKLWSNIPYISPVRSSSTSYGNNPGFLGFPGATTTTTSTDGGGGGGGGGGGSTHTGPFGGGYAPNPAKPKPPLTEDVLLIVDFNHDGRVDFIDFSILLYYFDKTGDRIIPFDLNHDGAVDMVDISIFMYYWDGS